jgi:hypothetical protein
MYLEVNTIFFVAEIANDFKDILEYMGDLITWRWTITPVDSIRFTQVRCDF